MYVTFLGLISFFLVKGIRLSVWKTRDLSIGGSNVTNVNYVNIGDQVKFVQTLKYYKQSLAGLSATIRWEEKKAVTGKYLQTHNYLKSVWYLLDESIKKNGCMSS